MKSTFGRKYLIPAFLMCIAFSVIAFSVSGNTVSPETEIASTELEDMISTIEPIEIDSPFYVELASILEDRPKIVDASTDYSRGEGLFIYTVVLESERKDLLDWANVQLLEFKDEFQEFPKTENLLWVIDYGESNRSEIIIVPIYRAADPSFYHYLDMSSIPGEHFSLLPESILIDVIFDFDIETEIQLGLKDVETGVEMPELVIDFVNPLSVFKDDFESNADKWGVISGEWEVNDEVYVQSDLELFDTIVVLDVEPLSRYIFSVDLRYVNGNGGGGIVYNMPAKDDRANTQVIDFAEDGTYLRYGYYDQDGQYVFVGGQPIEPNLSDNEWHTIQIITELEQTTFYLDDEEIVVLDNIEIGGRIGLLTNQAEVEFDDVSLSRLPGEINEQIEGQ